MKRTDLPERRLLIRCGDGLLCLDLTQVREVTGVGARAAPHLAHALGLRNPGPGVVVLTLETGGPALQVCVDGVGGVVDVPRARSLAVPPGTLLRVPRLVRALMRVEEPGAWRGGSMLPMPVDAVAAAAPSQGTEVLAADLDAVVLGRVLLEGARRMGWPLMEGGRA